MRFQILDGESGAHHHFVLRIESWSRTKKRGWELTKEVTLEDDESDEIRALLMFVSSAMDGVPDRPGRYLVIDTQEAPQLRDIIGMLSGSRTGDRLEVAKVILMDLLDEQFDPSGLLTTLEPGYASVLRKIAAASKLVEYRKALDELTGLVAEGEVAEQRLQALLEKHPWMFGSEYSERLQRRTWTRDDRHDFVLRRTVDGFLEVIEIKTPFPELLRRFDTSHESYYPSAKLSQVIGQVIRYIGEVERSRDTIFAKDKEDPLKIRARIVIGRDGHEEHQRGLRQLNAHLHGVEVITFDQLIRIAERVIQVFEGETGVDLPNPQAEDAEDDLPF